MAPPPLSPTDMVAVTMVVIVAAAVLAALLIDRMRPSPAPTPTMTALTVFISTMLFRLAATVRESVAAGRVTHASVNPESYALWVVFCAVLWLTLAYLRERAECRAIVAASRTLVAEAQRARTPLDHMPGEEWEAGDGEERDDAPA